MVFRNPLNCKNQKQCYEGFDTVESSNLKIQKLGQIMKLKLSHNILENYYRRFKQSLNQYNSASQSNYFVKFRIFGKMLGS